MNKLELKQALETILFVATHPLSPKQLAELIGDCEAKEIRELVAELNLAYEKTDRIFRIDSIADGLQMHTLPEHKKWAQSLETVKTIKLSPTVMETLAIIAYKQPLTRAGIELLPGRPGIYGTTKNFLEIFGLTNLKFLPTLSELNMDKLPGENQLELPLEMDSE